MDYTEFEKRMCILATDVDVPRKECGNRIGFKYADKYEVIDYNDMRYIDMINGKGSVLIGHNHPTVNNAIIDILSKKSNIYTGPNELIIELAEYIRAILEMPHSKISFFTTGTSACRAAVTAARKKTNKQMVVSSGYHGWDPMWKATNTILEPNQDGIVDFFFIPELLEKFLAENKEKVALCIISPDYIHIKPQILQEIIEIANKYHIFTCLDDVKQGFRYHAGSSFAMVSEQRFDMYTFSKGLANGNRLSCLIGNPEILEKTKNLTYTSYFDMIPFAAALATLKFMENNNGYDYINDVGNRLFYQINMLLINSSLPAKIFNYGSMAQFVFGDISLNNIFYEQALMEGLLLYKNDNQTISFSYDEMAIFEIIRKISNVFDTLSFNYQHLRGKLITEEEIFKTGWSMIDGAASLGTYDEKIKWINELIK